MSEKLKKALWFCCGFLPIMAIFGAIYCYSFFIYQPKPPLDLTGLTTLLIGTPIVAVFGIVLWAFIRKRNRMLALGFLFGGLAPVVCVLIMFRGCLGVPF